MPSAFAWVDFGEQQRRQMLEVVRLFREQETRDELGLGTIRDALADHFFPGTSTIQTRARYMLFVPWIYRKLERRKVTSETIARRLREYEIALIDALLRGNPEDGGIIGRLARKHLQRLPSSIYWTGLGAWGIRRYSGSQDQYHRQLDRISQLKSALSYDEDGQPIGESLYAWDPGLPEPPEKFLETAYLALEREEAEYLRDRILQRHQDSLLGRMLTLASAYDEVQFPWEHPVIGESPAKLQRELWHAQNFSETMHGAALLYNDLLQRQRATTNDDEGKARDDWTARLAEWAAQIRQRWTELQAWHSGRVNFWQIASVAQARIPRPTQYFVERWCQLVYQDSCPEALPQHALAQQLIVDREVWLKKKRARLTNPRALERWTGASGDRQIDYRWAAAVRNIVRDIVVGCQRKGAQDA